MRATRGPLQLLSLTEVWDRVDPLAAEIDAGTVGTEAGSLPYGRLSGPGFERLCYKLLIAEGHSPRFFGRSGERDYGVDIVTEDDTQRRVYQCKNLQSAPTLTDVRKASLAFEADWLNEAGLPRPDCFVYCCPHRVDSLAFAANWTKFQDEFRDRTGVQLSLLDRHALDARLRSLPDVVADIFNGSIAEAFCNRDEWLEDPWTRVRRGEVRHAAIRRFLDRHDAGAIYVSEADQGRFESILAESPVIAFRGLPGTGKTLTSIELICRLRNPLRHIYYASLSDFTDVQRLWQSVRRRRSLPAVFVLDNCHLDPASAEALLERLQPELLDSRVLTTLVLIVRDSATTTTSDPADTAHWLLQLDQAGMVVTLKADPQRIAEVAVHLRPELAGLSGTRADRLYQVTGGDLLLLDEALTAVSSPQEIDTLKPDSFLPILRTRYFGGNRRLPTLQALACLAQFDITPLASFLDSRWQAQEREIAAPLMTQYFAPARYQFVHSSLAELIARSLVSLDTPPSGVSDNVAAATRSTLISYLGHLAEPVAGNVNPAHFLTALQQILTAKLSFHSADATARLVSDVLADSSVRAYLRNNLSGCSFVPLRLSLMTLSRTKHPAANDYSSLICERFRLLFSDAIPDGLRVNLAQIGSGFLALRLNDPRMLGIVEAEHSARRFLDLLKHGGTIMDLLGILQNASPSLRNELLATLDDSTAGALVDQTVRTKRSVGALGLALRELGRIDADGLERLELTVGAARLLKLIHSNGTLFELFNVLQYSTPSLRVALIDHLDDQAATDLVERTIVASRSIGTISLSIRALRETTPALLGQVEQITGTSRFLRLITHNGTLIDLFNIVSVATPQFAMSLLDALTDQMVETLVSRSIASKRPISGLEFGMLRLSATNTPVLERLETAIGPERLLRLIIAKGTMVELFSFLRFLSSRSRGLLLAELDRPRLEALVNQTIAAGRSLGTLNLATRDLGQTDPQLLSELEQAIGARNFMRVIVANGGLGEFIKILEHATPDLANALIATLDDAKAHTLVEQTISTSNSISTFALAMRGLGIRSPATLEKLEEAIGADRFLAMIVANGTLFDLFKILEYSTQTFRNLLIDRLDRTITSALIDRAIANGRSVGTLHLTLRELGETDRKLLAQLEQIVGSADFLRLIAANGTLFELFSTLEYTTPSFRSALIADLDGTTVANLLERTLASGRSVESLHFALRVVGRTPPQRERLELLVGVDGWWRIVTEVGTLNTLSRFLGAMSDDTRRHFVAASSRVNQEQWRAILGRGLFLNACLFATHDLSRFPVDTQKWFQDSLRQVAGSLALKATWFDLSPSRPPADSDSEVGKILREAIDARTEKVTLEDLGGLDFREAVNALSFCWRRRPDLQAALATRLWDILPPVEDWPKQDGQVAGLRFVMNIALSALVPMDSVNRLLISTNQVMDRETCSEMHTLPLFLLLWNMSALRFERATQSFHGAFGSTLYANVVEVLRERVTGRKSNSEKVAQFALAGLLHLSMPSQRAQLHRLLGPLARSGKWLQNDVMNTTFVPALFALEGMALLIPAPAVFSPDVCRSLLEKSTHYEHIGPSIEALRSRVQRYGGSKNL